MNKHIALSDSEQVKYMAKVTRPIALPLYFVKQIVCCVYWSDTTPMILNVHLVLKLMRANSNHDIHSHQFCLVLLLGVKILWFLSMLCMVMWKKNVCTIVQFTSLQCKKKKILYLTMYYCPLDRLSSNVHRFVVLCIC